MVSTEPSSLTNPLDKALQKAIEQRGGWMGFDAFMALALYTPGLGYYANDSRKFGAMPSSGSDFVTAPELTPLFGQALANQIAQALQATGTNEIWEFGAGSGALALQLIETLGDRVERYNIVDLSGSLRARQQQTLQAHAAKLRWLDALPDAMQGVVVGNEVLDAMPVQLLARIGGAWHERGVAWHEGGPAWADRPTALRPPVEIEGAHDYLTEIHPQAEAFIRTLADRLERGIAFFIDYGFPEREYYHAQRHMGTLMCHRGHLADGDPLSDIGSKDITAHVNFTSIALAAQEAGFDVLGYTSQARFLMNCGLLGLLENATARQRIEAQHLIAEHEMGELFKVICLGKRTTASPAWEPMGFNQGDRTHRL